MSDPPQGPVALVADRSEIFCTGASLMLVRQCGFGSVLEAATFPEALELLSQHRSVSLACFDLTLPGLRTPLELKEVRERFPSVRVAVFTAQESRDNILLTLESGVHGFVSKALCTFEITRAFQSIMAGNIYVPPALAELPPSGSLPGCRPTWFPSPEPNADDDLAGVALTKRQRQILRLISIGRSNREIGSRLGLSENTVKVHANALYKKLRVHSRSQAAALTLSRRVRRKDIGV